MNPPAIINGQVADTIPITDRGLLYGDGVFETIAVVDGRLLCWSEHLARLNEGCRRLYINSPEAGQLHAEALQLTAGCERGVLKVILTRGSGGRGYTPTLAAEPRRILSLHPWPDHPASYREDGVAVRVCHHPLAINPALAEIKHLNRLEQILARGEWQEPEIAEGLMLDPSGNVIEGTMSNLFLVQQNSLLTPDVGQCGVAGIVRGRILTVATDLGLDAMITSISLHDLERADELFLCNSIIGLWPVRAVGEKSFTPGPISRALREQLIRNDWISPD